MSDDPVPLLPPLPPAPPDDLRPFRLTLRPLPAPVPVARRLAQALRALRRRWGFVNEGIEDVREDTE